MADTVRIATWNLLNYGRYPQNEAEQERYEKVPEVLATLGDVVCLQELRNPYARTWRRPPGSAVWPTHVEHLANDAGMKCTIPAAGTSGNGKFAVDPGRRGCGLALMWRPGPAAPVEDSVRVYDTTALFHGMVSAEFTINGENVTVASTHLTPWGPNIRYDEACIIGGIMRPRKRVVVCADYNCVSATIPSRYPYVGYYDEDPFADRPWEPRFLDKCRFDAKGRHWADREPMRALDKSGLYDVFAELNGPWQPTVGHWTADGIPKRIDGARASRAMLAAAVRATTVDTELTRSVSDHLPVVYEFDPARIETGPDPT